MRRKPAQLSAEAVSVTCPSCGAGQPCESGSEMWTREDFARLGENVKRDCCSCDAPLLIVHFSRVVFER